MTALNIVATGPRPEVWRRDDQHALAPAVLLGVLVLLMIVPEGLDYAALSAAGPPASADLFSRTLWLATPAVALAMIVRRLRIARHLARMLNPFLWLFVLLALASLAWTIDPALTSRRLYRLLAIVLVSIAFVLSAWHATRLQSVLRPVVTLVLFASALFAWMVPSLAVHQESAAELAGAWHGLANHKNGLGALACTGLLLWMHAGLAGHARWLPVLLASGLALLCMVMSRSSTAEAAAALCVSFMVLAMRAPPALRRHTAAWMIGLTLLLLVYALGMLNLVPGSAMLMASISIFSDKAATLTGRTEIWAILSDHIALRPWLGSGYAAYWTPGPQAGTESYEFIRRMGGFYPGSAHNGYLEVVNDLGGIGLACLMLYAAAHVRQLLRLLRLDAVQAALLMAMFLQQAVTNLSETHWFSVLSVDFVFTTLASTAVARSLLEQRWHATFGRPGMEVSAAGQRA